MSEHVYCVAVAFKMTEKVEQQICIKFCIKLEHSSMETIQMIQKAAAMGQVIGSCITTMCPLMHHVSCSVFGEMSNHPGGSASLQPRFGIPQHLVFPKTNTTFERDVIFRPLMKFRKIQWDG